MEGSGQVPGDEAAVVADVTVLWTEARGVVPVSTRLEPAAVLAQLNEYLDVMVAAVRSNSGTVDGVRGPSLSASFGAWDEPDEHARRACAAASDMLVSLDALNASRHARGLLPLELGIGIASGQAILGRVGPEGNLRRGVIGEPAALAQRLEGASPRLGTPVVLSRTTASRLEADQVTSLGWAEVRGVPEPVQVATLAWLVGGSDADS